jgi:hypothetical protein
MVKELIPSTFLAVFFFFLDFRLTLECGVWERDVAKG